MREGDLGLETADNRLDLAASKGTQDSSCMEDRLVGRESCREGTHSVYHIDLRCLLYAQGKMACHLQPIFTPPTADIKCRCSSVPIELTGRVDEEVSGRFDAGRALL